MKKRIAFFLAIAMIVTLLAGCGGGTSFHAVICTCFGRGKRVFCTACGHRQAGDLVVHE